MLVLIVAVFILMILIKLTVIQEGADGAGDTGLATGPLDTTALLPDSLLSKSRGRQHGGHEDSLENHFEDWLDVGETF